MERYQITCLKCKQSDNILISGQGVLYEKGANTPLLAARLRGDGKYGFQCTCGADSRLCIEEADDFNKLVYGSPMGIDVLKAQLLKRTKEPFRMVRI